MSAVSAAPVVCVSAPAAPAAHRVRLIRATARALRAYDRACVIHNTLATAFVPAPAQIERARVRCKHRVRRYATLEAALAAETGLTAGSVFNAFTRALPFLPTSLLIVNLPAPAAAPRRFPRPARLRSPLPRPTRRMRADRPIAYLPTCKGMGLAWPTGYAQDVQTQEGGRVHV